MVSEEEAEGPAAQQAPVAGGCSCLTELCGAPEPRASCSRPGRSPQGRPAFLPALQKAPPPRGYACASSPSPSWTTSGGSAEAEPTEHTEQAQHQGGGEGAGHGTPLGRPGAGTGRRQASHWQLVKRSVEGLTSRVGQALVSEKHPVYTRVVLGEEARVPGMWVYRPRDSPEQLGERFTASHSVAAVICVPNCFPA